MSSAVFGRRPDGRFEPVKAVKQTVGLRPIAGVHTLCIMVAMLKVFIVQHERPENDEFWEDVKFIGAFSTAATAEKAVTQLREQPGFKDYPDGFSIEQHTLDEYWWKEGFVHGGPMSGGPKAQSN